MGESNWDADPKPIREFVELANREGFQPSSIDQGRGVLIRYSAFVKDRFRKGLRGSGWRELVAYKSHLMGSGIKRSTVKGYMSYLVSYYRLRAESSQSSRNLDRYVRAEMFGRVWKAPSEPIKPFSREVLDRIIEAAEASFRPRARGSRRSEDYPFLMLLLYTGGRAQFYGLQTREVDFDRMEMSTVTKGGTRITIPLHPTLAHVLRQHLARRRYRSDYLFRHGHDPTTRTGQKSNRQNAWRACKRIQFEAGLSESVHPHRFRKTFATLGRRLGVDPRCIQAVLGHRNLHLTLDLYSRMELDEVKEEFAKVELAQGNVSRQNVQGAGLGGMLRVSLPPGKEQALEMVVRGLVGLIQTDVETRVYNPEVVRKRRNVLAQSRLRASMLARGAR